VLPSSALRCRTAGDARVRRNGPGLLLLASVLAGCTASASADSPTLDPPAALNPPAFDRAGPDRPASAPPIRWTRLAASCPELTGAAARDLGVDGMGRPTPDHHTRGSALVVADCEWGTGRHGTTVAVRMSIHRTAAAASAQWRVLSAGQDRRIPAAGPDAFSAVEVPALVIRIRSHNAVATVRVAVPEQEATEGRFEDLRPAAAAITRDVLDDLR
jgi:hypothetical protein